MGALVALLAGVFLMGRGDAAGNNHQPADKVSASGSTVSRFGVSGVGEGQAILSERLKVSTPSDLILQVTLECDILTKISTQGDGSTNAHGTVEVWIQIDGKTVPVSELGEDEVDYERRGEVTFCDRAHQREISGLNNSGEEDVEITDTIDTRNANAFNWLALNVGVDGDGGYDDLANGNNIVDVVVYARLTESPTSCPAPSGPDAGCAEAEVGKRTIVIEPTHAANDETVTELGAPTG